MAVIQKRLHIAVTHETHAFVDATDPNSRDPFVYHLDSDDSEANTSDDEETTTTACTIDAPSFPPMTCRETWYLWFHRDGARPPLRSLRYRDLSKRDAVRRTKAAKVIDKLTAVAIDRKLVSSAGALELMDRKELVAVFDDVFPAFVAACNPDCNLSSNSLCSSVLKWAVPTDPSSTKVEFPSEDCRTAWQHWFKGDAALTNGVPHRNFLAWKVSYSHRTSAKRVIQTLVQIAVERSLVPSSAPEASFEAMSNQSLSNAFDDVFPIFVQQFHPSVRASIKSTLKCGSVVHFMTPALWLKHPLAGTNTGLSRRPPVPCRDMWLLWFKGDVASKGTPYRHCRGGNGSGVCKTLWFDSKAIMNAFVKLAEENNVVKNAKSLPDMVDETLLGVFDRVFPLFVKTIDPKYHRYVLPDKSCSTLIKHVLATRNS
ncbi:Aste57867_5622 [Aphanomyces stellatus]|uniref:Aste57867_5622 protein n=1 Tax=Aphanomyces stellatus TaxID=120398 RepID=A0A485KFN4_9STRA|nr:hypothetical protein As57867_005609 [Aphanomyces stellatus]VFT82668.1 Aste57867_5622 [Aphanomyces stellatus]